MVLTAPDLPSEPVPFTFERVMLLPPFIIIPVPATRATKFIAILQVCALRLLALTLQLLMKRLVFPQILTATQPVVSTVPQIVIPPVLLLQFE